MVTCTDCVRALTTLLVELIVFYGVLSKATCEQGKRTSFVNRFPSGVLPFECYGEPSEAVYFPPLRLQRRIHRSQLLNPTFLFRRAIQTHHFAVCRLSV